MFQEMICSLQICNNIANLSDQWPQADVENLTRQITRAQSSQVAWISSGIPEKTRLEILRQVSVQNEKVNRPYDRAWQDLSNGLLRTVNSSQRRPL